MKSSNWKIDGKIYIANIKNYTKLIETIKTNYSKETFSNKDSDTWRERMACLTKYSH